MTVKESATSVPDPEHERAQFDWSDLQLFMLVARTGSLRRASKLARRSVNSLRRRLQLLEHQMNCRLLISDASGTSMTEFGRRLHNIGEHMFEASLDVARELDRVGRNQSHIVSIECSDCLANFWLIPKAVRFLAGQPDLALDFKSPSVGAKTQPAHSDIALCAMPPSQKNLVVTRLGYVHFQPFVSRDFIKRYGSASAPDELCRHKLVATAALDEDLASWDQVLPQSTDPVFATLSDSGCACVSAVSHGAGIGLLPTYVRETDARLVPILDEIHTCRDLYLTYRRDVAEHRPVRSVINWLKSVFDVHRSPWFRQQFVSPSEGLNQ